MFYEIYKRSRLNREVSDFLCGNFLYTTKVVEYLVSVDDALASVE